MLYRRLGRRYLPLALVRPVPDRVRRGARRGGAAAPLPGHVSAREFALIVAVAEGLVLLETARRPAPSRSRLLRPAEPVAAGRPLAARRRSTAWRALAGLPLRLPAQAGYAAAGGHRHRVASRCSPRSSSTSPLCPAFLCSSRAPRSSSPTGCSCASSRIELVAAPGARRRLARRARRRRARRARRVAALAAARRAAGGQHHHRRHRRRACRPAGQRRSATSGSASLFAGRRGVHGLARADAAAVALDPRAARRPARAGPSAVGRGDFGARVPVMATDETGSLAALVQRHGRRAGGARAAARGVRRLRRPRASPSACCSEGDRSSRARRSR